MAVEIKAPVKGEGLPGQDRMSGQPNPFLDEGWLETSYDEGEDHVTGPYTGDVEVYQISEGKKNAGMNAKRYQGDLKVVINMIREAANKLDIGVTIRVVPAVNGNGKVVKGQWMVHYQGKERKRVNRGGSEEE